MRGMKRAPFESPHHPALLADDNPCRLTAAALHDLVGTPDLDIDPVDDEDAELATDDPCYEPDEFDDEEDDE